MPSRVARTTWQPGDVREVLERWQAAEPEAAARLDAEALEYLEYHVSRYARLLGEVAHAAERAAPLDRLAVLDVGPNIQTALLRAEFPQALVDTLGFAHPAVPPREHERHIVFDLNDAVRPGVLPRPQRRYDVIVLAEVVEHLHAPLSAVLVLLREWLRPPGFIVIQTPNGAALHKRLALLAGRNPTPPPRLSRENPGHFHEYTLAELREQVRSAGLQVELLSAENHYRPSGPAARLYGGVGRMLPLTLRHGVTLCVRAGR